MCGILGLFSLKDFEVKYRYFEAANDRALHRGPDGHGFALFDLRSPLQRCSISYDAPPPLNGMCGAGLALGHRRLAIIDLSDAGAQPMPESSGSCWIVYNGEIYNYIELRQELEEMGYLFRSRSDTEVILFAYKAWGEECVQRFNGIWAFAIADIPHKRLFCSRDRFGVKPFHYFSGDGTFIFASEIKQILTFPYVPRRANGRAIYEYLVSGAIDYCDETFFHQILKLPHGHNLVLDLSNGAVEVKRYYEPRLVLNTDITYTEAASEFRRLMSDSVRLQLRSDVEVGSCLSGGLDSSSIVCMVHQQLASQGKMGIQRTFSSHFDDEDANELKYMKEIIRAVEVKAEFTYPTAEELAQDLDRIVWHQDEPTYSTSIFAQWSVFKLVGKLGVKVMLDGQGSDEQLAGYLGLPAYYFRELEEKGMPAKLLWEVWRFSRLQSKPFVQLLPKRWKERLGRYSKQDVAEKAHVAQTDWLVPSFAEKYRERALYPATRNVNPFGRSEHLNNKLYQLTFLNNIQALLRNEDRNSMAFSVEGRVPFLDHRLVEFIFSLPSSFKIRGGYTKRVLRDAMEGILPEKIRWRTGKLGFATPEKRFQQTTLKPYINKAIDDERMRGIIVPEKAHAFFDEAARCNIVDFTPWRWLNLSRWMECFELE